jgi:oligosaccharide repeat unit polymerase
MTAQMLKHPFVIYILSFGGVLAVYQLGWSQLYPSLSIGMLAFFGLTFLVAAALAIAVFHDVEDVGNHQPGLISPYILVLLVCLYIADFAYSGDVPLLSLLAGNYKYGSFPGIPTVHVFAVTFSGAFATIRFADFLYEGGGRRWRYLFESLIPLTYFALLNYRGALVLALISWAFIYIIRRGRLGPVPFLSIVTLAMIGLYLFGAFGDVRTGGIEKLGKPTSSFAQSGVPRTYFWGYIYFTSPLANFQYTVDTADPEFKLRDSLEFVPAELLPDFLSNRILPLLGAERRATPEIGPGLNVATIYARSYLYFGWIGVFMMFCWLIACILLYLRLILKSAYGVPSLALLNTLIFFCTFDNMIAQSFLALQLIWPLLLPLLSRRLFSRSWKDATAISIRPDLRLGQFPSQKPF